jgi:CBS-domain-containing membrane protein
VLKLADEDRFFGTPVKELVGRTRESRGNFMLKSTDSFAALVSLFTDGGYHRVLVIDEDLISSSAQTLPSGSGILLITQMDLLKFFWRHLQVRVSLQTQDLLAFARQILDEESASSTEAKTLEVISVKDDSSALDAFRFMYTHRRTAVAVVNSDGCLVANLSASNLRGIHRGNIDTLLDNVYTFLEEHNKDLLKGDLLSDQLKTAELDATADELVDMMLSARIHRVWLIDENDQPIGVITCTDILRAFLPDAMKEMDKPH